MPYFEKIPGGRIYLSPINPDDAETYVKWLNDIEVTRWLLTTGSVISLPSEHAWIEENTKKQDNYQFAIILRSENRLLGSIGFNSVNLLSRKATCGLFSGEAQDRNQGYGTEALGLLAGYGFQWLGLRNIDLQVDCENARAIACYKKVGFREYGRRTGVILSEGQWHDCVYMEILAENWTDSSKK
jgi:RimJ/RimL family protein N-acetyltransferase